MNHISPNKGILNPSGPVTLYVALSRHRASVALHYGQDDFADQSKLVSALSRERAKDMASDYAREFAGRRQIRVLEPLMEKAKATLGRDPFVGLGIRPVTPEPARGRFDGLRLRVPSMPEPQMTPVRPEPAVPAPPADRSPAPELPAAVTNHAKIVETLKFYKSIGEPYTPNSTPNWPAVAPRWTRFERTERSTWKRRWR